jgi:glycerol-3-phosphate dehydrogenase
MDEPDVKEIVAPSAGVHIILPGYFTSTGGHNLLDIGLVHLADGIREGTSGVDDTLGTTAALYGTTVVNHLEVTGLNKDASGKLCGARAKDLILS